MDRSDPDAAAHPAPAMDTATVKAWLWAFAVQTPEHAILLLDAGMTVLWANPGAAEILGQPTGDIVGGPLVRFFTPEDRALGIPHHEIAVATRLGSSEDDRWMQRADGSRFWASGRTIALRDDNGVFGFLKILRNQTELKMRLNTFSNRLAALEQDEDAHLQAFATLSHELRNPLSALNMAATALQRHPAPAQATQMLDIIQRNVGFIARMADDLEHAMRAKVGKLTLHLESLCLQDELQAAVDIARARADYSPRHIEMLMPTGAPILVEGDRLRVQQVFVNLIGNAIKFTSAGGHIWVKSTIEATHAVVRIEDDGAGIAPEMLQGIFRMFTQAERTDEPSEGSAGLGIGLALVKELVEMHGGSVQAMSDGLGKGAQFTVRLPLTQAAVPAP